MLSLLIALIVPCSALAQSAGDEQYADPFGDDGQQQQQQQQPQAQAQQPEAPAQPVEQPAAPAPADSTGEVAGTSTESTDPSLPVTGLPMLAMLLAGAGMLAVGAVVRRRA